MKTERKSLYDASVVFHVGDRYDREIVVERVVHYFDDRNDTETLRSVSESVSMSYAEAAQVADEMNRILSHRLAPGASGHDPAYEAHMDAKTEPASARDNDGGFSSHGPEPLPATEDPTAASEEEWKARLAEGGAS